MRNASAAFLCVAIALAPWAATADTPSASASAAARAAPSGVGAAAAKAVGALERRIEAKGGRLGAAVVDLTAPASLVAASNADAPMNPASNQKLATAAAALELLGPEHRFVTGLYGEAKLGRVDPLVLRSQGDPSLTTDELSGLVRQLRIAGVREVGTILVDQSYFDERYVPPAFDQQPNEWAAFRAPVAAVSVDRNTVTFWVRPSEEAGEAAPVASGPPGFVELVTSVKTSKPDTAEKVTLTLSAQGDRLRADVGGTIPSGSRMAAFTRRVDDPRRLAGYALAAVLTEQGVKPSGAIALGGKDVTRALSLHRSPSVAELLLLLGKDSDNFTAEMLFRAVGAAAKGDPSPEAAVEAVRTTLERRGALHEADRIVNGSGLFDANRLTARSVAMLLASCAADRRVGPEMVAHLAIGGVDGTLRGRLKGLRESRAVRAKTGTLAKAVALSGYVSGADGKPRLAFSFLVETPSGKTQDARDAIDEAVVALARDLD